MAAVPGTRRMPRRVLAAADRVESAVAAPAAGELDRAVRPAAERVGATVVMRPWIPLIWGTSATEALGEAVEQAAAEPVARTVVGEEPGAPVRTPASAARVARVRRLHPPVMHSAAT